MKETENKKMYYYFDESGDTTILGRHGKELLAEGKVSKTFIVGFISVENPKLLTTALKKLHNEVMQDEYLKEVPSIAQTAKNGFHANCDCHEVKEKVFKLLKQFDFEFYCIVARKEEKRFRNKFNFEPKKIYEFLVTSLLENRLHLYSEIDIYFAKMGNIIRKENMEGAIQKAVDIFKKKWEKENVSNIRVFTQNSAEILLLQAADYLLWTIHRAYEKNDFRYYNFIKDKIRFIHDIFDIAKYPKNYYSQKNPLEAKKMSPV